MRSMGLARTRALVFVAAVGSALLACDDLFVDPGTPTDASLAIAMSASATMRGDAAAAFDRADRARIQLIRSNGDIVFDEEIELPAAGEERAVDIEVELASERETFQLRTQLLFQGQVLFDGTVTITLERGGTASVDVPLEPVPAALDVPATAGPITAIGGTLQLAGAVVLATGDTIDDATITWASLDPGVATATSGGFVTAVAEGEARIRARHEEREDTVVVTVEVAVAAVEVAPASITLAVGETRTATATVRDANGNPLTRTVTWQSSAPEIAAVDAAGVVRGVAVGAATVTAAVDGVSSAPIAVTVTAVPVASVTVVPATSTLVPGGTVQLEATLRDAAGNVLTGRTVQWSSSNAAVALVNASGLVTAQGGGTATITAASGGRSGSAVVHVDQPVIQLSTNAFSVVATPGTNPTTRTIGVANGGTGTLERLSASIAHAGTAVGWLSAQLSGTAAPTNLTLDFDVSGLEPDAYVATVTVASTQPGVAPSAIRVELIVSPTPVAFVIVSPSRPTLLVGGTVQLTATAYDENENPLPGRTASWRSDHPQIATVNASGLVTAVAEGQALVHATIDGVPDSTVITVTQPAIALSASAVSATTTVQQDPAPQTVNVANGGSGTLSGLSATVDYGGGPQGWLTAQLGATTAPTSVTLDFTAGQLAEGTYTATVTVASDVSGVEPATIDVTLTVNPTPVAFVIVNPSGGSLLVGATEQLTATAFDSGENPLPGRTATWQSSDPAVATVDANGLVTGVGEGDVVITATIDGVSENASFTVILLDLQVSTNVVTESTGPEQNPPPRTVQVTNAGSSTISGLSTSITYLGEDSGWLSAQLSPTSTPSTLTLSYAVSSFGLGTYSAQVTVASANPDVAPEVIDVSVTISTPPFIAFEPSSAFFSTQVGVAPTDQVVTIFNGGSGSLGNLTPTVEYSTTESTGWLTASLVQNGDDGTLTLSVDMTGVTTGMHFANVIVSSDDPAVGDGFLGVQLEVLGFSVSISGSGLGIGTVRGNGFDCTINAGVATGTCTLTFDPDFQLTLTAQADTFSVFNAWSGDCAHATESQVCVVVVDGDLSIVADFGPTAEAAATEPDPPLRLERARPR
jgi:uncharacterized protein YjdB